MGRTAPFAPPVLHGYPSMLEALDWPEAVLLCGLRGWVDDLRRAADPMPRLDARMTAAGVPLAAVSLNMFLRIVARTANRPVGIGCPHCPRLAADEQRLLHAARLVQDREAWLAGEALRDGLLSGIGADFALGPLRGLGGLFLAAGLALRPRLLVDVTGVVGVGNTLWLLPPSTRH
ncbi:hypothetical protein ACFQS7_25800 [Dankookia sp. GCM10030260]|uniref:hypothetical protein n=1 Tax=Dankookia sp. GCM10030260 TaxID=3273390 RepID=UPI00360AF66C